MAMYSKKVLEHFNNPRNAGVIDDANGVGEIGDPECGDFMRVYIKVEGDIIADVKYQIRGCPASIACASAMTELAKGKNLDDVMMITDEDMSTHLTASLNSRFTAPHLAQQAYKRLSWIISKNM